MADASWVDIWIVPANTHENAAQTGRAGLQPCKVRRVLITWPAGCAGQVFVQVQAGGGYAFPSQQGQFMAFDDYTYAVDVTNQVDSGQWSVLLWNTDVIDHAIQVVYEYDYLRGNSASVQSQPIAL
jgi:hypothetical protein